MDLDRDFPDLVRAHQDTVYSIALRLTGRVADAEDAAQDAFVHAYRALAGFDDGRREALQVRPWLAAITLNVCRNRARTAGRRPQVCVGPEPERPGPGPSPSDLAEDRETAAELADALRTLPEVQRRAIVLHHGAALTYAEVATAVGRPEGTVKADVHRGVIALRLILRPQEQPA